MPSEHTHDMALPWTLHLHAVRYSCDESTFGHGKHQTFSLASSATSRAHRCKEDRRLDGCKEGPSKASPAESCELCNRTEPLLAPLPIPPPDPVVPINGPLAVFWGDAFPGYWLTPEVLSDIVRLSGADTSTYSRSNVSIESTNTPVNMYTPYSGQESLSGNTNLQTKDIKNYASAQHTTAIHLCWKRLAGHSHCPHHTSLQFPQVLEIYPLICHHSGPWSQRPVWKEVRCPGRPWTGQLEEEGSCWMVMPRIAVALMLMLHPLQHLAVHHPAEMESSPPGSSHLLQQ